MIQKPVWYFTGLVGWICGFYLPSNINTIQFPLTLQTYNNCPKTTEINHSKYINKWHLLITQEMLAHHSNYTLPINYDN